MTENGLYFLTNIGPDVWGWVELVFIRTLFSALMHATTTSIVGAALGAARFRGFFGLTFAALFGLAIGMGIHATWNGLITAEQVTNTGLLYRADLILLPIVMAIDVTLFLLTILAQSYLIRRELLLEAKEGVLPAEHAHVLSSWWKRHSFGWVPRGLDHRRYVACVTSLAQRRRQARLARGSLKQFYRDDHERLQRQVRKMLDEAERKYGAVA
jgi:hypothetical protein